MFDFGNGIKFVKISSYDEARNVVQYLIEQGCKLQGYSLKTLCSLMAQDYQFVTANQDREITGHRFPPKEPWQSYPDWAASRLSIKISNIDDLL